MKKGTAIKLQIVGETRSPTRKVRLRTLATYEHNPAFGRKPFFSAHEKAKELGGTLISIRTGVRLLHALSNAEVYGKREESSSPEGLFIPTPGLEMLLEGAKKKEMHFARNLPGPFWSGGLLISSGGREFGSEIVMGPSPWCTEKSVFQVPRELERAKGISLLYEPGTWNFYNEGNETLYLPGEDARPVWIPSGNKFDLSVLDKGTDLEPGETPMPDITIFVLSRNVEWVGPPLCAISPSDNRSIRISALLPPHAPMGAIMELPWESIQE